MLESDLRRLAGKTILIFAEGNMTAQCFVGRRGKLVANPQLLRLLGSLPSSNLEILRVARTKFLILAEGLRDREPRRRRGPEQLSFLPGVEDPSLATTPTMPAPPASAVVRPGRTRRPAAGTGTQWARFRELVLTSTRGLGLSRPPRSVRVPRPLPRSELNEPKQTPNLAAQLAGELRQVPERQLEVRFHPDLDESLLTLCSQTPPASSSDLILRRQALGLKLNPGFDILLSLPLTRGVDLLDYQLATVRHVLKHLRGRALLCDEVGLGKTVEAGLVALEYVLRGLVRRILVLTPPSLVEQWQVEMRSKFGLDFVTYDDPGFRSHPDGWGAFPRILASLDTAKLAAHRERLLAAEFDLVIVDEAHHLKNSRTQAHQLVKNLNKKHILLLTATPVENRLEDLFNLITLLTPGQLETAASFRRNYVSPKDPLKPRNTGELRELIGEVMVRNRRSETAAITSRRHAETVEVALSPDEAAFYGQLTDFVREHWITRDRRAGGLNQLVLKGLQRAAGSSVEAAAASLEKLAADRRGRGESEGRQAFGSLAAAARNAAGRAKGDVLAALLRRIGEKAVVFTGFQETHRFLVTRLQGEDVRVASLHGGMRRQEKEEQVELFRSGADVLVSTEIGSEGRNLHFARVLVNYDLPWNPMRIEQRIGRLHRLGQTRDVYVYNLSAADTIEAHILNLLDAKINMFQLVIGELDTILGDLGEKKAFEDLAMHVWSSTADPEELNRGMEALGERLVTAKRHYEAVKSLDNTLLGELIPHE